MGSHHQCLSASAWGRGRDGGACKGRESGQKWGQRGWETESGLVANARASVREHLQRKSCGFPAGVVVKNPPANAGHSGDVGSTPGLGRSPEEGHGYPVQDSCLENPMDRGA